MSIGGGFDLMPILTNMLFTDSVFLNCAILAICGWSLRLFNDYSSTIFKFAGTFFTRRFKRKHKYRHEIKREYVQEGIHTIECTNDNVYIQNGILRFLASKDVLKSSNDHQVTCISNGSYKTRREELLNGKTFLLPNDPVKYEDMEITVNRTMKMNVGGEAKQASISVLMEVVIYCNDMSKTEKFMESCRLLEIDTLYPPAPEKKYYYMMILRELKPIMRRYDWKSTRTLDTIFFKQKKLLIDTLNDFKNQTGMYHPRLQRPYKLCIFIHGKPGGGKSSLAKAIANETGRILIEIEPKLIQSRAHLTNILSNENYLTVEDSNDWLHGETTRVHKVPVDSRIICFDDTDPSQKNGMKSSNGTKESPPPPPPKGPMTMDKPKMWPNGIQTAPQQSQSGGVIARASVHMDKKEENESKLEKMADSCKPLDLLEPGDWRRSFDGALELHKFMAIFCTNVPREFEESFRRAGRMDLTIHLDYMSLEEIQEFLNFRYQDDFDDKNGDDFKTRIVKPLNNPIMPCELQELCQECKTRIKLEEVLLQLDAQHSSFSPSSMAS